MAVSSRLFILAKLTHLYYRASAAGYTYPIDGTTNLPAEEQRMCCVSYVCTIPIQRAGGLWPTDASQRPTDVWVTVVNPAPMQASDGEAVAYGSMSLADLEGRVPQLPHHSALASLTTFGLYVFNLLLR